MFFKYLHVFKAMATLSDYFDLNRRYFNITDTLIFEDRMIKLDMIPKYYFKEIMDVLYTETFVEIIISGLMPHLKLYQKHSS